MIVGRWENSWKSDTAFPQHPLQCELRKEGNEGKSQAAKFNPRGHFEQIHFLSLSAFPGLKCFFLSHRRREQHYLSRFPFKSPEMSCTSMRIFFSVKTSILRFRFPHLSLSTSLLPFPRHFIRTCSLHTSCVRKKFAQKKDGDAQNLPVKDSSSSFGNKCRLHLTTYFTSCE